MVMEQSKGGTIIVTKESHYYVYVYSLMSFTRGWYGHMELEHKFVGFYNNNSSL